MRCIKVIPFTLAKIRFLKRCTTCQNKFLHKRYNQLIAINLACVFPFKSLNLIHRKYKFWHYRNIF
jgi:hypothetical protein